jgi:cob(I)alamin adenosyltransferase
MSNRLTQIATRTGDDGTTGLGDGTTHHRPRTTCACACHGRRGRAQLEPRRAAGRAAARRRAQLLVVIQHELFNLGGELSIPGFSC